MRAFLRAAPPSQVPVRGEFPRGIALAEGLGAAGQDRCAVLGEITRKRGQGHTDRDPGRPALLRQWVDRLTPPDFSFPPPFV